MATTEKDCLECAAPSAKHDAEAPTIPIPRPLQYGDIPNATKTSYEAILGSQLSLYLDTVDTAPAREWRQKFAHGLSLTDHVSGRTGMTIDDGDAVLTLGLPGNRGGRLLPFFAPLLKTFDTEELIKRKKELSAKMTAMAKTAFGDAIEDMIEIEGLATAPPVQGKGYGTALMLFVNAMADIQKRGVYLITSDTHTFYQRFGYSIVQEDVLGADNPAWSGEPVPIRLMFRRPRKFPFEADSEKCLAS